MATEVILAKVEPRQNILFCPVSTRDHISQFWWLLIQGRAHEHQSYYSCGCIPILHLLDILIKEAGNKVRCRKRAKGVLLRLCQHGLCTALPGIFLSNMPSLCNKTDKILVCWLTRYSVWDGQILVPWLLSSGI